MGCSFLVHDFIKQRANAELASKRPRKKLVSQFFTDNFESFLVSLVTYIYLRKRGSFVFVLIYEQN